MKTIKQLEEEIKNYQERISNGEGEKMMLKSHISINKWELRAALKQTKEIIEMIEEDKLKHKCEGFDMSCIKCGMCDKILTKLRGEK